MHLRPQLPRYQKYGSNGQRLIVSEQIPVLTKFFVKVAPTLTVPEWTLQSANGKKLWKTGPNEIEGSHDAGRARLCANSIFFPMGL